jgi:hypothetical protein
VTALLTVCLAACCCLLTTGVAKLLKITELLGALMQQFVAVTQKMLIVAMYV